jgi:hypothetical protein
VIEDPVGHGKIYDLRFFLKAEPKSTAGSQNWIVAEVKRLKAAGEVKEGTHITDLAKLLEKRMREAAKTDNSIRPVGWKHIRNMLRTWGLWPITSIN